jgi:hypothetical protein
VIDLTLIDRDRFDVKERGLRYLINPLKSTHTWEEDELHLRSLVVDWTGVVDKDGHLRSEAMSQTVARRRAIWASPASWISMEDLGDYLSRKPLNDAEKKAWNKGRKYRGFRVVPITIVFPRPVGAS